MGQGCSHPGTSTGYGGLLGGPQSWELSQWVVYGVQSPGHALLSAAKFRFEAVPSFLAAVSAFGTCCLCPPSPAWTQGGQRSLKAAGCREPEHRAQGWPWEHSGEGEGCPLHLSKSMLGLSRSKILPSFVLAQQQSWRAFLRSRTPPRLPLGHSSKDAVATGKAKHPQKLGTAWRAGGSQALQESSAGEGLPSPGDVSFPICGALAPQGIALLGRVHVGQGPSSGQSNGIESSSKQELGASALLQGISEKE